MKSIFKLFLLFFIFLFFVNGILLAQPANNTCATADSLGVGSTCFIKSGTLLAATATNPGTGSCGSRRDVWYKFRVPGYSTSVTITVSLTGTSNLTTSNTYIELFNTSNCTLNTFTGGCNNISSSRTYSNLTSGNIYYFRVNTSATPSGTPTFNVCITVPAASRMGEVFQQTILSPANVLNYPWEVAYGPDDSLWVTESKGYKIWKMNSVNGGKRLVLDISQGSTFLPVADRTYNCQFNNGSGAQGGLAGLVLHPLFFDPITPKNYVYISYIYSSDGGSSPNGVFYTNRIVRFTYSTSTYTLGSPVGVDNALPGSSDHNSQRLIVAPVGATNYLFYGQGDMGAGQFGNRLRPNRAQDPNSYEGKILRFNLEPDGDSGPAAWIPNDNPYSSSSAVWDIGMRNNQGFAYDTVTNLLYGAAHGPYSDDEINIIEPHVNYGHPLIIGYVADGNYNSSDTVSANKRISAGAPFTDNGGVSACPPVGNEATWKTRLDANGNGLYKDPLFSAYPPSQATITTTWQTNPGNANWYSEAWSGLDLYSGKLIPGWKRSLVAAGLKWGRLIRLKLSPAGTTTMPSNLTYGNTADTVTYFQSTNRYRDLAFAPNGKDIFMIMDNSSATSGPGVGNPTVAACPGCVFKYSFLGYTDQGGFSSIPKSIPVADGVVNTCNDGTQVTIDASNNFLWVPITGPDGNIMAEINAMGQNLGLITSSFYKNSGTVRQFGGNRYLDRNITITPAVTSFATPVKVRLYISKAEFDALKADPLGGIAGGIDELRVLKNNDPCVAAIAATTNMLTPTNTVLADLQQGTEGYVLQVNVSSFSSFYFGANNISLPLQLLTFTGTLQGKTTTVLNWKTTNEVNTSHFIVERSADGQYFNPLGRVNVTGISSTENNYVYNDLDVASMQSANVFYRLKMFDVSGTYRYSNIIKVTLPGLQNEITVSPNPVNSDVHANIIAVETCNADWQIIDMAGRILLQNSTTLNKGNNSLDINISQLASGSYYLKIKGTCFDLKTKFQKF